LVRAGLHIPISVSLQTQSRWDPCITTSRINDHLLLGEERARALRRTPGGLRGSVFLEVTATARSRAVTTHPEDPLRARWVAGAEAATEAEAAALNSFLAMSDGLALVAAYALIREPKVRRLVVALVEQIVAEPDSTVH
jgi:hypothetical protein